jgi:hypothetical protein
METKILAELAGHLEPLFPNATEKIRLLLADKPFREMCLEYEAGTRCLRRLEQSREERTEHIEEYVELLAGLRQEIFRYLQDHGNTIK